MGSFGSAALSCLSFDYHFGKYSWRPTSQVHRNENQCPGAIGYCSFLMVNDKLLAAF